MKIINCIVKDDQIIGYLYSNKNTTSIISKDSLYVKNIFDDLMLSGYKYIGIGEFEDKEGNYIKDLPKIDFSSLNESNKAKLNIVEGEMYTAKQLASRIIEKDMRKPLEIKEPIEEIIKTREELINFLSIPHNFNSDDITTYMPLNSFCKQEALFSLNEYLDAKNNNIIAAINDRRNMSYQQFVLCKEKLGELGYVEGTDYINFLKEYFSWGICGLKSKIYEVKQSKSLYPLSLAFDAGNKFRASERRYHLIGKNCKFINPNASDFETIQSRPILNRMTSSLSDNTLIEVECYKNIYINTLILILEDGYYVEMDNDSMRFRKDNFDFGYMCMRIYTPYNLILPHKYWETGTKSSKEELLNFIKLQAITKEYFNCITVKSPNTYKALRRIGLDSVKAITYILVKYMEMGNKTANEFINASITKEIFDIIDKIPLYFNDESLNEETIEVIEKYISMVTNGEIVLDNISDGRCQDAMIDFGKTFAIFELINSDLNFTLEQIAEKIKMIKLNDTKTILFNNGKYKFGFNIIPKDMEYRGYLKDVETYRGMNALLAPNLLYITQIFSEPDDSISKARHIAVKGILLKRTPKLKELEERLTKQILIRLEQEKSNTFKEPLDKLRIIVHLINAIFKVVLKYKDTLILSKDIEDKLKFKFLKSDIDISYNDISTINSNIEYVICSTAQLLKYNVFNDNFRLFTVNAIVTPYWVVPTSDNKITVAPIYPSLTPKDEKLIKLLKDRNLIPQGRYEAIDTIYKDIGNTEPLLPEVESNKESLLTYKSYFKQYGQNKDLCIKPKHPYDILYKKLYEKNSKTNDYSKTWPGKFHSAEVYEATSDKIKNISDETKWLFDIADLYIPIDNRFSFFTYFNMDEMLEFKTLDEYNKVVTANLDGVKAQSFKDSKILFEDGRIISFNDLNKKDINGLAVTKVRDGLFLIKSYNNRMCRIVI